MAQSVHLADFAFKAYLDPTSNRALAAIQASQQPGGAQTVTRYVDDVFIRRVFQRAITITVLSAKLPPIAAVRPQSCGLRMSVHRAGWSLSKACMAPSISIKGLKSWQHLLLGVRSRACV